MLRTRLLTAIILIPVIVYLIYLGGVRFLVLVALLLTLAEVEFCRLLARKDSHPAFIPGVSVVWICLLDAQFPTVGALQPGLTLILLLSLAWQLFRHQHATLADWALAVASGLYLGLCGASLIELRGLRPDGVWWTLIVVPSIFFADAGAYLFGSLWGQHKLIPILSFGKTWEGYLGGIASGSAGAAGLALLWCFRVGPESAINGIQGLLLGFLIATLAPIGDLIISMVKRQAGVKDSGHLFPGHGGALDRMDSILWAAVIGRYYVLWFVN